MKKILLGLIVGILFSLVPTVYAIIIAPKYFSDVDENDWYFEAIRGLNYAGLVEGYSDGTFRPNQNITRAEASKLMFEIYNELNIITEFYELKEKYEALNAKISTLEFPGDCYADNQWYSEGEENDSGCVCNIDGRIICPSAI